MSRKLNSIHLLPLFVLALSHSTWADDPVPGHRPLRAPQIRSEEHAESLSTTSKGIPVKTTIVGLGVAGGAYAASVSAKNGQIETGIINWLDDTLKNSFEDTLRTIQAEQERNPARPPTPPTTATDVTPNAKLPDPATAKKVFADIPELKLLAGQSIESAPPQLAQYLERARERLQILHNAQTELAAERSELEALRASAPHSPNFNGADISILNTQTKLLMERQVIESMLRHYNRLKNYAGDLRNSLTELEVRGNPASLEPEVMMNMGAAKDALRIKVQEAEAAANAAKAGLEKISALGKIAEIDKAMLTLREARPDVFAYIERQDRLANLPSQIQQAEADAARVLRAYKSDLSSAASLVSAEVKASLLKKAGTTLTTTAAEGAAAITEKMAALRTFVAESLSSGAGRRVVLGRLVPGAALATMSIGIARDVRELNGAAAIAKDSSLPNGPINEFTASMEGESIDPAPKFPPQKKDASPFFDLGIDLEEEPPAVTTPLLKNQ